MYSENERRIYEYHNGEKIIAADPMVLARRVLMAFEGDPNKVIDRMDPQANSLAIACEATDKFVAGVRQAFDLKPFDPDTGEGTLEQDVHRVWNEYQEWVQKKSPATDPSLT